MHWTMGWRLRWSFKTQVGVLIYKIVNLIFRTSLCSPVLWLLDMAAFLAQDRFIPPCQSPRKPILGKGSGRRIHMKLIISDNSFKDLLKKISVDNLVS